jgi:hypothetical protein
MRPDKKQLDEFNAFYKSDTEFASNARLRQSIWRENKGFKNAKDKLSNYLDPDFARTSKSNFLTDRIKTLVQYEVYLSHQNKKLISEPRIWENLLSSQPLAFNLFGELHFDLKLATKFFKKRYPASVKEVTRILFEHSPSRGSIDYTGDHSAFDVFIEYISKDDKKGFIGIEVKYAEDMSDSKKSCENIFKDHGAKYIELSHKFQIFKDGAIDNLKNSPLQQVWRDHLLAISTLKDYDQGSFVFLYPKDNSECDKVVTDYQQYLIPDSTKCRFIPETLEDYVNYLSDCSNAEWIKEFITRYLD